MKLFDAVPNDLFSPLASPNRVLYADALDVLYVAYQDNLRIPEDMLYSMLRNKLEQQLADATFEGEDIDPEELRDISGRARFLIRKLCSKGWFEKERGSNFEEFITVPGYSSRILELLHQLRDDSPARGDLYVFSTYSMLKVANEGGEDREKEVYDKMKTVYGAYENTRHLVDLLQMVYHNVRHYCQLQLDIQTANGVLDAHFNDFGQNVIEAYIRPLKIRDSVYRYHSSIKTVLESWEKDSDLLLAMANAALQDKRGETLNACCSDLRQKISWIKERYEKIKSEYLNEIDAQVRRYTKVATQKLENIVNRDRNVRGNINFLLMALSQKQSSDRLVEQIQPAFQLYEQSYLSERSLWHHARPGKRTKGTPVIIQQSEPNAEAVAQTMQQMHLEYGREAVDAYVQDWLGDADERYAEDLKIQDDKAYIMCLLAMIYSTDADSEYQVKELDGSFTENSYTIPRMLICRRRKKE